MSGGGHLRRVVIPAIVGACLFAVMASAPVQAQQAVPKPDRFELTVLGGVVGGGDLGDASASLLTNQVPTGGMTSLFATSARIDAAPVVEGRFGVRLSRRLWIEGGTAYSRPDFAVDISADIEGAPDVTATSTLTQLVADVGLQYRWDGRRYRPFVMGGAGYLRQLDEPRTTAETGWIAYGGAGMLVQVAPASQGILRHVAIRGDVRILWLRDGIILTDQRGPTYQATAGLAVGF